MPLPIPPEIEAYAVAHTTAEPPHFREVAATTAAETAFPQMMTGTLEGRFLKMLTALVRARLALDIGTFTGYSALSIAEALPPDGRVVTCEASDEHAAIARRHFAASPVGDRIELRVGPALDTIATLEGPIDLVFIDADKTGYLDYYEAVLPKLAPTGVIAVDNVLWSGRVLDDDDQSPDTAALRAFNDHVAADPRVECVMLTIRDGVTLIRRRS
jgi:caffeoyl-CoA O-methyltransferase